MDAKKRVAEVKQAQRSAVCYCIKYTGNGQQQQNKENKEELFLQNGVF